MAARRKRRHTHQQLIPVARPGAAGLTPRDARPRWRIHVPDAENYNHALGRPAPGANQPYDALDDADNVRLLHNYLPKRAGVVLGRVQLSRDDNTGVRNGLEPSNRYAEIQARRACFGGGERNCARRRNSDFRAGGDVEQCRR